MLSTESYIVLQYNLSERLARDQSGDLVSLDPVEAEVNEVKVKKVHNILKKFLCENEILLALRFSASGEN